MKRSSYIAALVFVFLYTRSWASEQQDNRYRKDNSTTPVVRVDQQATSVLSFLEILNSLSAFKSNDPIKNVTDETSAEAGVFDESYWDNATYQTDVASSL